MERRKDCIIIGAGITGLTAAYYLKKKQKDFLVLDSNDRVGGVIKTISEKGFLFETGPNTGVLGQPEAAELFGDLGDKVKLEIASDQVKKRYVLKKGKWHALPSGLKQAISTPLFTTRDKFRILGEPFRRRGRNPEETLKDLVIRRMGNSFLDYAIDPFILGVYAGDPGALVPKYALPKLYALEQQYGSFIGGAIKKKLQAKTDREKKATRDVFSVKGGLQSLVNALYEYGGPDNFVLNADDTRITKNRDGWKICTQEKGGLTKTYHANHVIITAGSHKLQKLLPELGQKQMDDLTNLRYAKVIEVAVGFKKWQGMPPDAFGGLIPFKESRDLLGILYPSAFLQNRAPENGQLFTLFMGGIRRPELFELDDEQIFETVKREFTSIMKVESFDPDLFRIFRYTHAIPQYGISSGARFEAVKQVERECKGLLLRGNFCGGIGLADRIRQGKLAADQIIDAS